MNRIIIVLILFLSLDFVGCAAPEVGIGNKLANPPEITYEERAPAVFASAYPKVEAINPLQDKDMKVSFSFYGERERTSAWERGFSVNTIVVPQTEMMMRNRLLHSSREVADDFGFTQPAWSALGKLSFSNSELSYNFFGASRHYYPFEAGEMRNQRNVGGGLKWQLEKDVFFRGSRFFFEVNALKNTKNGLAMTFCPGLEMSLFEAFGFTVSPALATCTGTYYTKEDKRTLPILGFMPGVSIRHEYGVAFNFVFLLENPFLPVGKAAAAIGYVNKGFPDGTTPYNHPVSGFGSAANGPLINTPIGGFASFEIPLDAFNQRVKPQKKRWW